MYLKSLELKGFKSFAETTVLDFFPGITAIVGPNGSGKSNIVDAISWVLGTLSTKNVRSSKMEDVIFNGSSSRPPLGRAEVSLTIHNSEFELPVSFTEVKITRVLFRNQESSYYINDTECRLTDVLELLSDANIGKSQHVIVGQGQLDTVLNLKPEERRIYVEEVAGISKFKKRKSLALARLEKTRENMLKLRMVLRDLNSQIVPLEKQAAQAQTKKDLERKRKLIEIYLLKKEFLEEKKFLSSINFELAGLIDNEKRVLDQISLSENSIKEITNAIKDTSRFEASDLPRAYEGLLIKTNGLIKLIKEKRSSKERDIEVNADSSVFSNLEYELSKIKIAYGGLAHEEARLRQTEKDNAEIKVLSEELSLLEGEKLGAEKEFEKKRQRIVQLKKVLENLATTRNNALETYLKTSSKAEALSHALDALYSNPSTKLESLGSNTLGVLLDAIVIEPGYERAVKAALNGLGHLKVLDEEVAGDFLKGYHFVESLEFLVLSQNFNRVSQEALEGGELLLERVKVKDGTKRHELSLLLKHLLSDVVVLDLDPYNLLEAYVKDPRFVYVNRDGHIIKRSYVKIGLCDDPLISPEQVDKYVQEAKVAQGFLEQIDQKLQRTQVELGMLESELGLLQGKISNAEKKVRTVADKLEKVKTNEAFDRELILARILEQKAFYERRIVEIEKRLEGHSDQVSAARNRRNKLEADIKILLRFAEILEKAEKSLVKMVEILYLRSSEGRKDLSVLETQLKEAQANLSNYLKDLEEIKSKKSILDVKRAQVETRVGLLSERMGNNYSLNEEQLSNFELPEDIDKDQDLGKLMTALEAEIEKIGPVNALAQEELEALKKRHSFLAEQYQDVKNAAKETQEIITSIDAEMLNHFDVTFSAISEEFDKLIGILFEGSRGHLELVDSDDPLEAGVELVVKHPNKSFSRLSLLSGGERSLVSMAFLFSMFRVRPTPFCVLDEVEPALDDVNLGRFLNLLTELKKDTQILIVTHQKKTMEVANLLWGITMAPGGTTRAVSERLEAAQDLAR